MVWFGISNTCGGAWPNGIGKMEKPMKNKMRTVLKRGFS